MKPIRFELIHAAREPENRNESEERTLIESAQQGDSGAFKELYDRYRERVYNLVYYSLSDTEQAEDALQTVFVKVFKALPYFRLESRFSTWLYRVALNECKNRKKRRNVFVSLTAIADPEKSHATEVGPDTAHELQELNHRVRDAVKLLKPKYRNVVVLKYLEEMSYEEVAETLGCSVGTVASRLFRALQELERRLRSYHRGDGGQK